MHYVGSHTFYETAEKDGPITLSVKVGYKQIGRTTIYLNGERLKECEGSFDDEILGTNAALKRCQVTVSTLILELNPETDQTSVKVSLRGGGQVLRLPTQRFTVPKSRGVVLYDLEVFVI